MIIFIFFDGGMVLTIVAMLFLALIGILQQAFPVITVILWILFAVSAGASGFLALFNSDTTIPRRILNFIINVVSFIFIGIVLNDYIVSLQNAMDMGGINGLLEFILVGIFGAVEVMLMGAGLSYAGLYIADDDATLPYGVRIGIAIAALLVAAKLIF